MRNYKLVELSDNSEQWYMFFMSDRDCHQSVVNLLDSNASYATVMDAMAQLFFVNKHHVNNRSPHRIMTYMHMAESMDRLYDVNPNIIDACIQREDMVLRDVAIKPQQPNEQEIPMKFTTVHYINGTAIPEINDEKLIKYISDEKKARESLVALGTESTAIGKKIAKCDENIKRLVSILDSRVE